MFVNSKCWSWDGGNGLHRDLELEKVDEAERLQCWFISSFSFVARANELLNGHWMAEQLAEKSDSVARLVPSKTLLELDLDYLERRGADRLEPEGAGGTGDKDEVSPADSLERVKVIFLGAPAVGKSSIIRQFVWNEFSDDYVPSERRETYYPSVVYAERMYELKITDLPSIPYFPINSHLEWTDFRYYGLRSATAYVLVFDLSSQDTFQYIKTLREQMYEARDMSSVPLLVVGNKQDKLAPGSASSSRHRDIVNLVRKHWRCGYVECSARYNCRVVQVFRELMKSVQASLESQSVSSPTSTSSHSAKTGGSQEPSSATTTNATTTTTTTTGASGENSAAPGNSDKCILL